MKGNGRPSSQFHILLWYFTATAWKCVKTLPRTLVTKVLAVALQQHTISHFPFNKGIFYQKQHDCCLPPILLFSGSLIEDKTEGAPFWHNSGDQGRIADNVEDPHTTRLPGCVYTMAEVLGMVYTHGRGLLRGWWWPLGPKLIFNQMAAPVPEIIYGPLHTFQSIILFLVFLLSHDVSSLFLIN
jgi:hypothetical protein